MNRNILLFCQTAAPTQLTFIIRKVNPYFELLDNIYSPSLISIFRIAGIFQDTCQRRGIIYDMADIIQTYKNGYRQEQLSLF